MSLPYDTERAETEMRRATDLREAGIRIRALVAGVGGKPGWRSVPSALQTHAFSWVGIERIVDYAEAMSPSVALAVAGWLEAEADHCDDPKNHAEPSAAALAVAAALIPAAPMRQTNGEEKR